MPLWILLFIVGAVVGVLFSYTLGLVLCLIGLVVLIYDLSRRRSPR